MTTTVAARPMDGPSRAIPTVTSPAAVRSGSFAIETRDLTKRYGAITAVNAVNLRVHRGEVYGFLGPNGAGKTTTLRMLLGLIAPSSGSISVLGAAPGTTGSLSQVGAMIETPAFYPYLSGADNLAVLAAYTNTPRRRIPEVLDLVDLADRASDPFRAYSLGMKQRLGVAAALLKNPPLLLLDEPTNGLDPAGMADMRALIRRLGHEGHTVLLSSHLMNEVEQVCDRLGVIAQGEIVAEGTVADLRGQEALVIGVSDPERARTLLASAPGVTGIDLSPDSVRIGLDRNHPVDVPALNRTLVTAGIDVHELRTDRHSLEEIFLNLTGGETHHAA